MTPEGERAVNLLRFANYARVGEALGVSRSAVARWSKGEQVTPWQLERLQDLLGYEEAASPRWAKRLATRKDLAELEERLTALLDERQRRTELELRAIAAAAAQLERLGQSLGGRPGAGDQENGG